MLEAPDHFSSPSPSKRRKDGLALPDYSTLRPLLDYLKSPTLNASIVAAKLFISN